MLKQVLTFNQKHHLFSSGDSILLACSGGPDSLCMVHIFNRLAPKYNLKIFVAHIEHGIRGQASIDDAIFVKNFCKQNNIPFYMKKVDACSYSAQYKLSLETGARILRYNFLNETAQLLKCTSIATAHNRGDQAETVLMHIIRGSGTSGLSGIHPRTQNIIRPLLACTRSDIEEYCQRYKLSPRHDFTNDETTYIRNNIRLKLLPFLRKYNPNIESTLSKTASLISEENDFIAAYSKSVYDQTAVKADHKLLLPLDKFSAQHTAIKRRLIRLAIYSLCNDIKDIENIHITNVLSLAQKAKTGSQINLPNGLKAYIEYSNLIIALPHLSPIIESSPILLNIPGTVVLNTLNFSIKAEIVHSPQQEKSRNTCYIDTDTLCGSLKIRFRKNGDTFCPKGMKGHKKLKDLFIDNKIPREQRSMVPIVCDDIGIVWVAGIQQDNRCISTSVTKNIVKLTILNNLDKHH